MTHAFFKALLFLAAGTVIESVHEEHNIFRMGGLRSELPLTFWTFLIARLCAGRVAADHGRIFQQGPDYLGYACPSPGGKFRVVVRRRCSARCLRRCIRSASSFVVFFGPRNTPVDKRPGYGDERSSGGAGVLSLWWRER